MITTVYSPTSYTSDGVTTDYDIGFDYNSLTSNIKVSAINDTGTLELLTQGTDYTVNTTTNKITLINIPIITREFVIELDPDFLQEIQFNENTAAPAAAYEHALDVLTLEAQALREQVARAIKTDILSNNLGTLGTMAQQDSDDVNITGGHITGLTQPLAVADGGTGATTASAARTSLGLGTMSIQDSDDVNITDGSLNGLMPNISALTEDTSPDSNNDYTIIYSASDTANRKSKLLNLSNATVNLVLDTSPQLGGDLDLNTNSIVFPTTSISDVDTDGTLAANSDTNLATQKATKTYVDTSASTYAPKAIVHHGATGSFTASGAWVIGSGNFVTTDPSLFTSDVQAQAYISPISGTLSNIYVNVVVAPGTGKQAVVQLYLNGSVAGISLGPSGSATSDNDTTSILSIAKGDYINIRYITVPGATTNSGISVSYQIG